MAQATKPPQMVTCSESAEPIRKKRKKQKESGQVIMGTKEAEVEVKKDAVWPIVAIDSRSVRLGSLKGTPSEPVTFSAGELQLKLQVEDDNIDIVIKAEEVTKIFAHFGAGMPVMWLTTTPQCAASIRDQCHMTTNTTPYYDPISKEKSHRWIVILINEINKKQVRQFCNICQCIEEACPAFSNNSLLEIIEADQATDLLVLGGLETLTDCYVISDDEDEEPEGMEAEELYDYSLRSSSRYKDDAAWPTLVLASRTVWLGSLKGTPSERVTFSAGELQLELQFEDDNINIVIKMEEVIKILAQFGAGMPVVFLTTTLQCAASIRDNCYMTTKTGPYYDPNSKEKSHRWIVIQINRISIEQIRQFCKICQRIEEARPSPSKSGLLEIEADQASDLLLKSAPVATSGGLDYLTYVRYVDKEPEEPYDFSLRSSTRQSPQLVFDNSCSSESAEPIQNKSEKESGLVIMGAEAAAVNKDDAAWPTLVLGSRTVWVGPLIGTPSGPVTFSAGKLKLELHNEYIDIVIKAEEVTKIFAQFGAGMPVVSLTTTPQCAASIRDSCYMTTNTGPYYDPNSKEKSHRWIVIQINRISIEQIRQFCTICQRIEKAHPSSSNSRLLEIEADQANDLLVKNSPVVTYHYVDSNDEPDEDKEPEEPYNYSLRSSTRTISAALAKPLMSYVSISGHVHQAKKKRKVTTKYGRNYVREVRLCDDEKTILVSLWGEAAKHAAIRKGDWVHFRNVVLKHNYYYGEKMVSVDHMCQIDTHCAPDTTSSEVLRK